MKTLTINSRFLSRMGKEISKSPNGVQTTHYGLRITIAPREYEDHYNVYHKQGKHLATFIHNHGTDNSIRIYTHDKKGLKINCCG